MKSFVVAAAMALTPLVAFADHPSPMPMAYTESTDACHIEAALTVGSKGAEVMCLQSRLIEAGHLTLSVPTGYFGSLTKAGVMRWQASKNVAATGYFGSLSIAAWNGVPAPAMQMHEPMDVSAWPSVPSVSIVLHKDSMSGYNLEIVPVNFRFAPEHVNGAVLPNEGHAHLYIDGKKVSRVYGSWTHLAKEYFIASGDHEVHVTLNANDHSDLAVGDKRIEARAHVASAE